MRRNKQDCRSAADVSSRRWRDAATESSRRRPRPSKRPPASRPAPMSLAPQGRPSLDLTGATSGFDRRSISSFGPNGGVFFLGNHAVVFPAQSVCDPATSSYGPSTWDDPCTPAADHAESARGSSADEWQDVDRLHAVASVRSVVELQRAGSGCVDVHARTQWEPLAISLASTSSGHKSLGGATVDETPSDATLRTYVDTFSGISLRRIKHFSDAQSRQAGVVIPRRSRAGRSESLIDGPSNELSNAHLR